MRRSHAALLQGEAAASTLPGWGAKSGADAKKAEVPLKEYRYIDRDGERIAKFPVNRDDDVCGSVASASSPALTEYHDKLKCINFREQGLCKPEIAEKLGRSERWVKRWWREIPALIERPGGEMLQKAALASFRDVDIRRRFLSEDEEHSIFRAADSLLAWKPAKIVRRDMESGGLALAYDQKGNSITDRRGRLVADYSGGIDGLDKLLQRIFSTMQIRDPQARIFLNHYKDGAVTIGTHRHDHWSLVVSLGAERILMVDNKPVLTRNGDLVNFGTQSHSVPSMPDIADGRISLVVFYYPDSDNMERRRWRTVADGEEESAEEEAEEKYAGYNPGAQKLKTSADSSWNVSILWGEVGTGGHGATALSSAKTSKGALAQSLTAPSAPNLQINSGESNSVASMCPITVFALGVGSVASEREFFMLLTGVEVQQLWDMRSPEVLRSNASNFSEPDVLKRSCAVRCITYHSVSLGRRAAGGIEGHIVSDEGRDCCTQWSATCSHWRQRSATCSHWWQR